jgi:hypothetical protein
MAYAAGLNLFVMISFVGLNPVAPALSVATPKISISPFVEYG